jgi:hypothetical protein
MHVERADDVVAVMVACAAAYGHAGHGLAYDDVQLMQKQT